VGHLALVRSAHRHELAAEPDGGGAVQVVACSWPIAPEAPGSLTPPLQLICDPLKLQNFAIKCINLCFYVMGFISFLSNSVGRCTLNQVDP
jgi:hypothetical protein